MRDHGGHLGPGSRPAGAAERPRTDREQGRAVKTTTRATTRTGLLRSVGAATALYGLAVAVRPQLVAVPSGLTDLRRQTADHTKTALRPLAWRDLASGLALATAPRGPALRTAALLRIAADAGDALLLGYAPGLPDRRRRRLATAVSVGWGALSAAGLVLAELPSPPNPPER